MRFATTLGGTALVGGVLAEFFIYDGGLQSKRLPIVDAYIYYYFYCAVDAGSRAVIFDKISGVQKKVVGEGSHFKIPFIQVCVSTVF